MPDERTLIERKGFSSGPFTFYYLFWLNPDGSIYIQKDGWKYNGSELDREVIKSISQYGKWAHSDAGDYSKELKQKLLQMKLPIGTTK